MKSVSLFCLCLVSLCLSGCVEQSLQQAQTQQAATGPQQTYSAPVLARQTPPAGSSFAASSPRALIAQMNATRRAQGLSTLRSNERLNQAARLYAQELASRQVLDHTDLFGQGPEKRVEAAGYTWTYVAENLAAGQDAPAQVIKDWLNSPAHKAALLNTKSNHVGVGLVKTTNDATKDPYGSYWVAVFAKPL